MRDVIRQRACGAKRTEWRATAMGGVTALSNVRAEATRTDVRARCEHNAGSQSSARMPRDAHQAARARDSRREGVEQRTS